MRLRPRSPSILLIGLLVIALAAQACGRTGGSETEGVEGEGLKESELVAGNTAFALDLYARLRSRDGNLFLSPYSISTALTMTYTGAKGNTAREMATVLRLYSMIPGIESNDAGETGTQEFWGPLKTTDAFGRLQNRLLADPAAREYELSVANALWVQAGQPVLDGFRDGLSSGFRAGHAELDFAGDTEGARRTINAWVEERTNDRIKDLIQSGMLDPATALVLTNAIYFRGFWATQFDPDATRETVFHGSHGKATVRMMHRKADFGYAETEELQILEMPYEGDLSMVVLLPRKGLAGGLGTVERRLSPETLAAWTGDVHTQKVSVFFPRFAMTTDTIDLSRDLVELGIRDAFAPVAADFSGIDGTRELYISMVLHKAFVEVTEEGTEAAAATAVVMKRLSIRQETVFRADRPFLFLIRDNATGSILFMGRVNDIEA